MEDFFHTKMAIHFHTQTDMLLLAICSELVRCGCKRTSCFIWRLPGTRRPLLPCSEVRTLIESLTPCLCLSCPFSYISVYFPQISADLTHPAEDRGLQPCPDLPTSPPPREWVCLSHFSSPSAPWRSSYSHTSSNLLIAHIKLTEKDYSLHLLLKTSLMCLGNKTSNRVLFK